MEKEAHDCPKIWRGAYKLKGWGRKGSKPCMPHEQGWGVYLEEEDNFINCS